MNEYISRDYKGLPEEYWKYQTFCWYIHDIILSLFHDCLDDNKMNTNITFRDSSHAKKFEEASDIFEWLYNNGYEDEANEIFGKRIFHAILADMMNFIYESLNTIEKGKITVSLALLRKPMRDNLLYLEWLLGDSKEFVELVRKADIEKYAIERVSAEKKLSIIKNAMDRVDNKDLYKIINEDLYYDLRYNKDAGNSLQKVWDKANHLVTTRKHNRSDEFNFVFLDEEIHREFIDYYYKQVPHLLFYIYNIVLKLYEQCIRKIEEPTKIYNNALIVFKLYDMLGTVSPSDYFNSETIALLNFICLECEKLVPIDLHSTQFEGYRYGWSFDCPECQSEITVSKYVFLEDFKKK
ncbi:hypothetical protein ACN6KS_26925 [Paenibacillus nitricinens]|uniref:hypothetical protein n=1 Tax=Paenibacillus nitricinens TaxID=3367691 RepID=UPI003F8408A1